MRDAVREPQPGEDAGDKIERVVLHLHAHDVLEGHPVHEGEGEGIGERPEVAEHAALVAHLQVLAHQEVEQLERLGVHRPRR